MTLKIEKEPSTFLYPCPVVLVTTVNNNGTPNIVTLAWVGVANSTPPMLSIAVREQRHSHGNLMKTKEFVVNIPSSDLVLQTDHCGTVSGKEHDKFAETGLTPEPSKIVKPPGIRECPVNVECRVRHTINLGSHDLFIGEVVAARVEESVLGADGRVDVRRAKPLAYTGRYWRLGRKVSTRPRLPRT